MSQKVHLPHGFQLMTCSFQGTLPFVSIRLLWAWLLDESIIHTAVDDLESFIWLLSWTLVHILKNYGSKDWGILQMEDRLSSKDLTTAVGKAKILTYIWPDAAFGYLMRDWQRILTSARTQVEPLRSAFFKTSVGSPA